ncbi:MAG: riboflavin synthase [Candidatus Burarchaeum sp.]|nr:riboflavin synthase [Candidatus Burarchaeum sp.]MDO8340111.1 riboflavin synthase [Candidatus Burarchaeum sp.]
MMSRNVKLGMADTTFARVDMASFAADEISRRFGMRVEIVRRTVPGIKDLAVECKRLLELDKCDVVLALGMVGRKPIDTQCGHEASLGIQMAKMLTNRHIVEVFVHENEAKNDAQLLGICENRARKHAVNAVLLVASPQELSLRAGMGVRQGFPDEGPVKIKKQRKGGRK